MSYCDNWFYNWGQGTLVTVSSGGSALSLVRLQLGVHGVGRSGAQEVEAEMEGQR